MFSQGHIVAGIFGVFSSIGWIIQAAGGGILYKRVSYTALVVGRADDRYGTTRMVMGISLSKLYVPISRSDLADKEGNGSDESCFYQEYHIASIAGLDSEDRTYMHLILSDTRQGCAWRDSSA
jgi:hypothetical protein